MVVLVLFLCAGALATQASELSSQQALADWRELARLYNDVKRHLQDYEDGCVAAATTTEYAHALLAFTDFESNYVPKIERILHKFRSTYGASCADADSNIVRLVGQALPSLPRPSMMLRTLRRGYAGARRFRRTMAAQLLRDAQHLLATIRHYPEHLQLAKYDEAIALIHLATQFDAQCEKAITLLHSAREDREKCLAVIEHARDLRGWPGDFPGFIGPGNPRRLRAAAYQFLTNTHGWHGSSDLPITILALSLRSNWYAVAKNVFGEPTQWGLPVYAAVAVPTDDTRNVMVYELTLCTSGKKPAPPFTEVFVSDSWVMRRSNLPREAPPRSHRLVSPLLRVILATLTLIVGILAAAPWLTQRLPQSAFMISRLAPQQELWGLAAMCVALLVFLRNLFLLRPFADLLPIVLACATGLVLCKHALERLCADTPFAAVFAAQEQHVAALERQRVPLGITTTIAGVLHLLFGSWWLI